MSTCEPIFYRKARLAELGVDLEQYEFPPPDE
jgi:hypothetical protein